MKWIKGLKVGKITITLTCTLLCICLVIAVAETRDCVPTATTKFEDCSHTLINRTHTIKDVCENTLKRNDSCVCTNNSVCSKQFRLSIFNQQLFAITMKNAVLKMLSHSCDGCSKCLVVNILDDLSHFNTSILKSSDIVFPVISESYIHKLYEFYFLPAMKVPSSYYITLTKSSNTIAEEVILACAKMWPLLLMCLLFAAISGFIIWAIETHTNVDEFPRRFYVGIFDGFWWSFVTMTTLGYGDIIPKSYAGRLYAIFWILIGIVLISVFTGTLTSEIINAREPGNTEMSGMNVGVLRYRLHDRALVAKEGGILRTGTIADTMTGIDELITMLENKSVHGFLIDRNTYYHFYKRTKAKKYMKLGGRLKNLGVTRTEKYHNNFHLRCGIMFKDKDDFEYFKPYFDNHHLDHEACNSLRMTLKKTEIRDKGENVFAMAEGGVVNSILYCSLVILGVIMFAGVFFEGRRYYVRVKSQDRSVKLYLTDNP